MKVIEFLSELYRQCGPVMDAELQTLRVDGDKLVIRADGCKGDVTFLGEPRIPALKREAVDTAPNRSEYPLNAKADMTRFLEQFLKDVSHDPR